MVTIICTAGTDNQWGVSITAVCLMKESIRFMEEKDKLSDEKGRRENFLSMLLASCPWPSECLKGVGHAVRRKCHDKGRGRNNQRNSTSCKHACQVYVCMYVYVKRRRRVYSCVACLSRMTIVTRVPCGTEKGTKKEPQQRQYDNHYLLYQHNMITDDIPDIWYNIHRTLKTPIRYDSSFLKQKSKGDIMAFLWHMYIARTSIGTHRWCPSWPPWWKWPRSVERKFRPWSGWRTVLH